MGIAVSTGELAVGSRVPFVKPNIGVVATQALTDPRLETRALRRAMLVNNVDMMGGRAFLVSSAHDEEVIDQTIAAFSQSLRDLQAEGAI